MKIFLLPDASYVCEVSSCSTVYKRYKEALEEKKAEEKLSVENMKRKAMFIEVKELKNKRRKFEVDVDMVERNADELCEKAEKESCSLDAQIRDKEEHLKSL